jgi:hypothetical protein
MKPAFLFGAVLLAAGLLVGTGRVASAQADRTLGINCTVAGHQHCGEDGPIVGSRRLYAWYGGRHRWRYHHGHHHRRY